MMLKLQERLKEERKKKFLTQKEIAKQLNIQRVTYNHYETGRSQPSIDTLIILSEIFDCSIDYLVGVTDNRTRV